MSDYTPAVDFSAKDALATGDGSKLVLGAELDTEFNAMSVALATKADGSGTIVEVATSTFDPNGYTGFSSIPTGNLREVRYSDGTNTWVVLSDDNEADHCGTSNATTLAIDVSSQTSILPAADTNIVYSDLCFTNDLTENLIVSVATITNVGIITFFGQDSSFDFVSTAWSNSGGKGWDAGWVLMWRLPQIT